MNRFLLSFATLVLSSTLLLGQNAEPIRVAIYKDKGVGGQGVPRVTEQLTAAGGFEVVNVNGEEVAKGALANFDVIVFSGGSGSGQGKSLGEAGRKNVQQFIRDGGGYVGICAGSYLACTNYSWGLKILNAKTVSPKWRRGRGQVEMEIAPAGVEATGLEAGKKQVRYVNGPIIEPANVEGLPAFETLAYFRTELAENDSPAGIMVDSPAIARSIYGKGRVIISSPHPEQTDGLENFSASAIRWAAGTE